MSSVTATIETSSNVSFGDFVDTVSKEESNVGLTWNGDYNYQSLGDTISSMILEMKQKLLNNVIQDSLPRKVKSRSGVVKGFKGLPKDSTLNIPLDFRTKISDNFSKIMIKIKQQPEKEQCLYMDMIFRSIFHERAIPRTGQGKGHRSIMFHLWHEMYNHMPETCLELLYLIPEYGCFRDLDNIMHHYISGDKVLDYNVINKCSDVYYFYLSKDFNSLFGKNMNSLSHSEIRKIIENYYSNIQKVDKSEFPRVSFAGKYIGRENKKFDFIRNYILAKMFFDGDITKYNESSSGFKKFAQTTFRYYLSILNTILGTVEPKMSSHNYKDINPTKMTSGSSLKYRKYLVNETLDGDVRSDNPDAKDLRERTIQAAINNALNGAGLDSVKLANLIGKKYNANESERLIINAQFNSLFESIKCNLEEEYKQKINIWLEGGSVPSEKPLEPFNVIATIDVSGSMDSANVMNPAVLLGIIVTKLSKMGNTFLTFSDNPTLVTINPDDNIFDIFDKVKSSDWGGSTDIDKANQKLATIMNDYKKINPAFSGQITHIIFTDGQFNSNFVHGWTELKSKYNYNYNMINVKKDGPVWNTAVNRMEKYFTDYGLSFPNTVFWNMNATSPGFPTTGDMKGLQLANGLSHGMLVSILTNANEFSEDDSGIKKASITPVESFHKTIYHSYFDDITKVVHHTHEGVYSNEYNRLYAANFMDYVNK
jgi:hypothetical protein